MNRMTQAELIDALRWKLALAAKRNAELDQVLKSVPQDGYRAQEIRAELREIETLRIATQYKLDELLRPTAADPDRQKRIAAERERRLEDYRRTVERHVQGGDFRQARVWGMELFSIPDHVAHEFSA